MENNVEPKEQFLGAIPLLRKFREHPFWREKRTFSRAEAWIDLLFKARYGKDPEKIIDRGEIIHIQRGGILTGIITLSDTWLWSEGKVKRYLEFLQNEESIKFIITKNRRTIIDILNYGSVLDNLSNHKKGKRRTEEDQREDKIRHKNTDNTDNKDNINKNGEAIIKKESTLIRDKTNNNKPSGINEILMGVNQFPTIKISTKYQEKAYRYAEKLGIDLKNPMVIKDQWDSRWVKIFKIAESDLDTNKNIEIAYSYLFDNGNFNKCNNVEKIKYFFWKISN